MSFYVIYVTVFLYVSTCLAQYSPLIEIEQGVLRGVVRKDIKGKFFYGFFSVPYAKKPIGNLRFMMPVDADKWHGIFNATEDLPMCMQRDLFGNILGQEDCLYLNVYTPKLVTKKLQPVMVFIHGGGFVEGNGGSELYGPEFLMPQGVVLVTMNYRLGLFGFLNFKNSRIGVSGNMGLKDQNMALKWVQRNIGKFGGDPNCVTIFGESAGGVSVHFHMLSPMSQGLFHRVIAQSGTALNTYATIGRKNTGIYAAKFLGYEDNREFDMLAFLQEASTDDIMKIQENATILQPIHELSIAAPIVENIRGCTSFLPDHPGILISSKEFKTVPFMLGFTNNEAILWDVLLLLTNQELQDIPPERAVLYSFNITDENIKIEIANKIRNFYYGGNHSSFDNLGRYKLGGDAYVYWEALKSAKYHAKIEDQNVYLYMFSADTELNYFKRLHPMTAKIEGASHIDDLGYIFKTIHTPDIKPRSPEWNAMERVVKLWTNFAKYGNPTPKRKEFNVPWKLVRGRGRNYMDIGTDSLNMRANPFRRRMAFWDMLEEEYVTRRENKGYVS